MLGRVFNPSTLGWLFDPSSFLPSPKTRLATALVLLAPPAADPNSLALPNSSAGSCSQALLRITIAPDFKFASICCPLPCLAPEYHSGFPDKLNTLFVAA